MEQLDFKFIDEVLQNHQRNKANLISILQDVQAKYNYLPKEALSYIANALGISEAKIFGVATFYGNFSLNAKGKYVIKVCRGTACHVRRSDTVLSAICEATGLSEDAPTTADGLFSLEIVSCLGACGLSPVVMVNDEVFPQMTPDKARDLIAELRNRKARNVVELRKREEK